MESTLGLQANGLFHTSPGQRPGFTDVFDPAQANGLLHQVRYPTGFNEDMFQSKDLPVTGEVVSVLSLVCGNLKKRRLQCQGHCF